MKLVCDFVCWKTEFVSRNLARKDNMFFYTRKLHCVYGLELDHELDKTIETNPPLIVGCQGWWVLKQRDQQK